MTFARAGHGFLCRRAGSLLIRDVMIAFVIVATNCSASAHTDSDANVLQNLSERVWLFFRLFRRRGCNSG
jgi:hypothetical protein